jgi:transcriptional regulator with XRE-family HTH domain
MGYRGKIDEQNRARDLRAQGWTLTEICEEVGVSKNSASAWCRDVEIDEQVLERRRRARFLTGNEGARQRGPNKLQRRKAAEIARLREEGSALIGALTDRELLIAGLAYYSGEGAKRDGVVTFANTDPRLIRFFMTWLRRFFEIDEQRLRVRLYLHQGLDLERANAYWSALTGIPTSQFREPHRPVADSSIRTSKHPMGCPSVSYSCTRTHRSIMGMIDALLSCPGSPVGELGGPPPPQQIDPG